MNFLIILWGSRAGPSRWLRKMEPKLFNVAVAAAIIVSMVVWLWVLAILAQRLLISVLDVLAF